MAEDREAAQESDMVQEPDMVQAQVRQHPTDRRQRRRAMHR